jgi:diadenylate cyclase
MEMNYLLFLQFSGIVPLRITSLVEILILGLIIYKILLFAKESGGIQLLLWMGVLGTAYFGGRWANLQVIPGLLGAVFPYLVFSLIVVFQGEIRRGLGRITRNPFSTKLSQLEARHFFEDVLMAVNRLAAQRTGALMVVEREASLRTYAESGIPLQSRLSQDLLVTIFQPGAPLHDGAVIIRKDRIIAATCFLPLSVNPIWGTQLGTRHRAAVGITEETDSVAIVVSEETGFISIAFNGSIEMDTSVERLSDRMNDILGHSTGASPMVVGSGPEAQSGRSVSSSVVKARD